ncbi:unnamed protein product [Schistosoma mattheei]|uniref:Uncharacterized protein n=1 Tax=Schistosoma mattheei TaxID=31246 RepID=A0A183P1K9_9TREM|nr:unnamed protein product [Schistosoma mattheei]
MCGQKGRESDVQGRGGSRQVRSAPKSVTETASPRSPIKRRKSPTRNPDRYPQPTSIPYSRKSAVTNHPAFLKATASITATNVQGASELQGHALVLLLCC